MNVDEPSKFAPDVTGRGVDRALAAGSVSAAERSLDAEAGERPTLAALRLYSRRLAELRMNGVQPPIPHQIPVGPGRLEEPSPPLPPAADAVAERDGERVLVIGHSATRLALEVVAEGRALDELVGAPFEWQPGWEYVL